MDKLRVLIARERIAAKVAEMGQRISQDFAGEPVVLIGVLKGATLINADRPTSHQISVQRLIVQESGVPAPTRLPSGKYSWQARGQ